MTKSEFSQFERHIQWLEVTDSTNLDIRRRLPELDNLSVIAARFQTAGRGQGSHTWLSPAGENLTFSVLLRFGGNSLKPLAASEAVRITQVATVSMLAFLKSEGVRARIKWPNDVWVGDRKICGMLIENILEGTELSESIVGIGLNLNQLAFDPALPNPVSLRQLTGREYDPSEGLFRLYKEIRRHAEKLNSDDGRLELEKVFCENLFHLDESARTKLEGAIADFEARR